MILLVPCLVSTSDNLVLVTSLLLCFHNPVAKPISLPHNAPVTLHFYFATSAVMLLTTKGKAFFICHFEIGFRFKTNRLAEKSNLFLADPHTWDYSCISDVFPLFLWKFVGQSMKIFSTIICALFSILPCWKRVMTASGQIYEICGKVQSNWDSVPVWKQFQRIGQCDYSSLYLLWGMFPLEPVAHSKIFFSGWNWTPTNGYSWASMVEMYFNLFLS